ncbi:MAG TPA: alpha/beta hydrolase [Saprospiraceae bacterium]|nr:alpha/beta hydrolase [Saprospiraceae bacterium]
MNIHAISGFKHPEKSKLFLNNWIHKVQLNSGTVYERIDIKNSLGNTVVWGINTSKDFKYSVVIFPGYRTSSLFWDLDNGLEDLKKQFRIYLVETNGQPNLSDGNTPDIHTNDYGLWATEIIKALNLTKPIVVGASFGGLVCLKLAIVSPTLLNKVILMNPGCLQPFSLKFKNVFFNLLPILFPFKSTVRAFLDNAIVHGEFYQLSPKAKDLVIEYELYAIKEYKDRSQKPYRMSDEDLNKIKSDVYLMVSDHDILFPFRESLKVAKKHIRTLRETNIVTDTGHGMELSKGVLSLLPEMIVT